MTNFAKEKTDDGKYVHFYCNLQELRESCYLSSAASFPSQFITNGDSMKELVFRYSVVPYEKYFTGTERLLFDQIEKEWQRVQDEHA